MCRWLLLVLLALPQLAQGADVTDATGRQVHLADRIARVLPAGPPAAVLLSALAPDLMVGWPHPPSPAARTFLPDSLTALPVAPPVTGSPDATDAIRASAPDVILDYGDVGPRYVQTAVNTQQNTGIPTLLLDGKLTMIPAVLRTLGNALHREDRAETLARLSEAILALPDTPAPRGTVVYARGADGLAVAAPGTGATEVFALLGWKVLAPDGQGTFRHARVEDILALDPDLLVFADPAMRATVGSEPWRSLRAVREHHVLIAPSLPFGWVDGPPSINRLIGLMWLRGNDAGTAGAIFNSVVYGRVLSRAQIEELRTATRNVEP
jgi:iron complex transport system substrate-binding protein